MLFPEPGGLADSAAYQEWYTGRIEDDLAHARLGLSGSPLKAALEVLRSRRDVLRHAVDFGGLEEKSHDEFYGSFTAVLNRSVTGPQLDRHQELLALVRAGVVAVPLGPEPDVAWDGATASWRLSSTRLAEPYTTAADWLCHATSGQPDVERTGSRLLAQLARDGLIRRHRPSALHSRGADLSPGLHPVGRGGEADERIWVLGPLSEGATFYNHYVPSPGGFSRALSDAHRAVAAMLAVAQPRGCSSRRHHGGLPVNAALATLPILVTLGLLAARVRALFASLAALGAAAVLTATSFRIPLRELGDAQWHMVPTVVELAAILFGGILLSELMTRTGAQSRLGDRIGGACSSPSRAVLLVMLGVTPFAESLTGFGIGVIVAIPLLRQLGLPPAKAAVVGLLGLVTVPWGSLAPGSLVAAELGKVDFQHLGIDSAVLSLPVFLICGAAALTVALGARRAAAAAGDLLVAVGGRSG
ncbi:hypothetical protein GCM10020000_00610 [Streptomyces olivoverticillatus]